MNQSRDIVSQWTINLVGRRDVLKRCVPYKFSGIPGPLDEWSRKHNVPAFIIPCHYALYNTFWLVQNGRDVSMQGHCVFGTINQGDQGSQNILTGTNRFGTPRHPTQKTWSSLLMLLCIFPQKKKSAPVSYI